MIDVCLKFFSGFGFKFLILLCGVLGTHSTFAQSLSDLRLNQVQMKATHNSYHLRPPIISVPAWEYDMPTLYDQFQTFGVRSIELDVHLAGQGTDYEVYHLTLFDSRSTCRRLRDCLSEIRRFSDDHPAHSPIIVWIEVKDFTGGEPIENLDLLDETLEAHLGDRLFRPDDLKGSYRTLKEAVNTRGWPRLDQLRGRVLFVLLNSKGYHAKQYTHDFRSLDGRAMFAKATSQRINEGVSWAVVTKVGIDKIERIKRLAQKGFLVATTSCRAYDTEEACIENRKHAKASGAHMIKDDFVGPNKYRESWFKFPGQQTLVCNPVTANRDCRMEETIEP